MNRISIISIALAGCLASMPIYAGVYTDDMSRCLVTNTTLADKTNLVKWVFSVASLHPEVAQITAVSDEKRADQNRTVGQLFERLLTSDCRKQTQDAIRYEGSGALRNSFEVLGQVAMRELTMHPAVEQGFTGFLKHVDEQKIKDLAPTPAHQ